MPPHQAELLLEALTRASIEAKLHIVPGAGHGVGGREVNELVDAFFDKHLEPAGNGNAKPPTASREALRGA